MKLLAPNGKPSNLTAEQYKLVRTPAFKKWFGDWENDAENSSKVVDDNGEPLVCYHVTDKDFNIFKPSRWGKMGIGIYFTPEEKSIQIFNKRFGNRIIKAFLKSKKLLVISNTKKLDKLNKDELNKIYDGIRAKNINSIEEIKVLNPEQIKLADGTNITFDANNPDIRYAEGGIVNENYLRNITLMPESYWGSWGKLFKAEFGENGGISWEITESYWEENPSEKGLEPNPNYIIVQSIDRDRANGNYTKEASKGEGAMAIASLFLKYSKLREIGYDDYAESGFWQKIGGDSDILKREDFFKYFENKFGYNPDIRYKNGGLTMKKPKAKLLAPNGKPSNLTPEQYRLVRTPAFKAWFGDWEKKPKTASKCIDSNGEPLVLYHGTNAKFTVFDTDEESENRNGGTWNAEYPDGYIFMHSNKKEANYYGKRIIPLFVSMKYPKIKKVKRGSSLVLPFDDEGLAYDGDAIVTDGIEYVVGTQDEFQIKLADGSNITFDGSNPDIRYKNGGEILWNIKGAKDEFLSAKELFKIDEKKFWRERYLPKLEKNILSNSELNEDEWRLVNSENFIKWFGDWRKYNQKHSLVLNTLFYDDGDKGFFYNEPQIVYHASYNDFNEFNKLFIQNDTGFFGRGFYFGTTYHQVIEYGRIIKKYFINLRNPFYFEGTEREFAKKLNLNHLLEYDKEYDKYYLTNEFSEEVTKYLISENYDGLIINSTFGKEVIAFYPNQIKLADGTNTTFDSNNPDIRYAEGGHLESGGELTLTSEQVEQKLGRKLHWWNDDVVTINGTEYKKVFLKPEYKRL